MLKLAAEKELHPMVETVPTSEKGCAEAVSGVANNKIKHRRRCRSRIIEMLECHYLCRNPGGGINVFEV